LRHDDGLDGEMRAKRRSGNALRREIMFPVWLHIAVASLVTSNEA
jgi:hypothetical protein